MYDSTNKVIRNDGNGVSIADVQAALGTSSGDLATLCLMNNINMWSARKPVFYNKVSELSASDWASRSLYGYSISYGIKKRVPASLSEYIPDTSTGEVKSDVWTYDKPVLGSSVFRLTDFLNYYVEASNPMTIELPTTQYIYMASNHTGTRLRFRIRFDISKYTRGGTNSGNIRSRDMFAALQGYYPSVLMTFGTHQFAISSEYTMNHITDDSGVTAIAIEFNAQKIYQAMAADAGTGQTPYGTTNESKWTACVVLLSNCLSGGTLPAEHSIWDSRVTNPPTVVRLEYASPVNGVWVDRKILTVKPLIYTYISSMKARFTLESINSWWTITSITFIANVEQSDANLTFTASASATTYGQIYVGTNYVANQYPNTSNLTVNSYSTANLDFSNTTGTGVQRSLTYLATKYSPVGSPSAPYKPLISLVVTLHNTYGDWRATLTIQDDLSPRTVEVNCTVV